MASGINWNNYTSTQIMQMSKIGMEVPSDVLKSASAETSKFEFNDEAIRGDAETIVDDFLESDEFKGSQLKDQVEKLGKEQKSRYNEARKASEDISELESSIETFNSIINDKMSVLDENINNSDENLKKSCSSVASDINKAVNSVSAKASSLQNLYQKAVVAEKFAEKVGETADKFIKKRSAVKAGAALVLTGGVVGAEVGVSQIKGEKIKMAEEVKTKSTEIISDTGSYKEQSNLLISKMNSFTSFAKDNIEKCNNKKEELNGK